MAWTASANSPLTPRAPFGDRGGELAGAQRQRPGTMERRRLARQVVDGAQVAVELAAVVLLDDQHARDTRERHGEPLRLRGRQQAQRNQPHVTGRSPASAGDASRAAAVVEPKVITARSPSPSMSAQKSP